MASWAPPVILHLFVILWLQFPSLSLANFTHLPGLEGEQPFHIETGFVTVDEVQGVELFYYFVASERDPKNDPLLIWLTGGPGCSGFSALFFEIGPVRFHVAEYDGTLPKLFYNQYTWTKVSSIIFLDYPSGTGFSSPCFTEGYEIGDTTSSAQVHQFLRKWLMEHPQFIPNPFYVAGDSYGGKLVPIVAQMIADGNEAGKNPQINIQGYITGNPKTGEKVDSIAQIPYARGMGIISDEFAELVEKVCAGEDYERPKSHVCAAHLKAFRKIRWEIMETDILEPKCATDFPKPKHFEREHHRSLLPRWREDDLDHFLGPPQTPELRCITYPYYLAYFWVNANITREALHVKKGTVREWQRCNTLDYNSDIQSSLPYQRDLLRRGYRALVYSGDHDMLVPFVATKAWIKSLKLPVVDPWRSWSVENQVAGYTVRYSSNLTFATLRGAGHTAPQLRPQQSFAMFERWTSGHPI